MVIPEAFNETKGATVATNVRIAKSMWARFWGLMGRRSLPGDEGLWIAPCSSVHTFFMRFPIDVVFLDRGGRVVKIVAAMKPWRAAVGGSGAHSVLELNAGKAAGAVEVGDLLVLAKR
jgi:hypothetical protein